jgi:hypothetical protein
MQNAVGRKAQAGAIKHRFVIRNLRISPKKTGQKNPEKSTIEGELSQ